ncbi:LOB domain-containing protein 6 [Acorus gramineus]|uniref:LOB domain-containing protein 6 n=1 Tax=Acorus gramineus TaxID=55184 RepID=A0AAV9A7R7_ACOGR|nr:LOB domain-containing protein 6 [Acorus gramineus]
MSLSSSISRPCAACKFLRRKCMDNCVFAPQFPPDQPERFASVHRVFGAGNVSKILQDIDISQRNHAVDTLVYEAETRLQNPVYGPVACIALLNETNQQIQHQLTLINRELSSYHCNFLSPNPMHPPLAEQQQEQVQREHQQQQQQMLEAQMIIMHEQQQRSTTMAGQQQMMMMHAQEQQPTQMLEGQMMIMHEQQEQPSQMIVRQQEIHGQHQPPGMLEVAAKQEQQQRSGNGAKRRLASS